MKLLAYSALICSACFAGSGAAPGSAKAWELDQARKAMASKFDSSSLKGPKPTTQICFGIEQAWFADWNLSKDQSPSGPVEKASLKRGQSRFLGIFDERGWISELRYYDARNNHRWTRVFTYKVPAKNTPSAEVTWMANFYDATGEPLERDVAEKTVRDYGYGWTPGHTRFELKDALGDALIIQPSPDGGETWTYFDGKFELKFRFDKEGKLVEAPPRK